MATGEFIAEFLRCHDEKRRRRGRRGRRRRRRRRRRARRAHITYSHSSHIIDCASPTEELHHGLSKDSPHLVGRVSSSQKADRHNSSCHHVKMAFVGGGPPSALTNASVTFSWACKRYNETKVKLRMKLNLGFSCDSCWNCCSDCTPKPNKTRPSCSCFLVPLYPSLSPVFFFFPPKRSH